MKEIREPQCDGTAGRARDMDIPRKAYRRCLGSGIINTRIHTYTLVLLFLLLVS